MEEPLEIKLRGWDTDNNKFLWSGFNDFTTEIHTDEPPDVRTGYLILNSQFGGLGSRVIFQQYIGVNDKNEKEIYYGDIVKFAVKKSFCKNPKCDNQHELGIHSFCPDCGGKINYDDFVNVARISYSRGSFCLFYHETEDSYHEWKISVAEYYIAWIEVIGNIYETPELLPKLSENVS